MSSFFVGAEGVHKRSAQHRRHAWRIEHAAPEHGRRQVAPQGLRLLGNFFSTSPVPFPPQKPWRCTASPPRPSLTTVHLPPPHGTQIVVLRYVRDQRRSAAHALEEARLRGDRLPPEGILRRTLIPAGGLALLSLAAWLLPEDAHLNRAAAKRNATGVREGAAAGLEHRGEGHDREPPAVLPDRHPRSGRGLRCTVQRSRGGRAGEHTRTRAPGVSARARTAAEGALLAVHEAALGLFSPSR